MKIGCWNNIFHLWSINLIIERDGELSDTWGTVLFCWFRVVYLRSAHPGWLFISNRHYVSSFLSLAVQNPTALWWP